MNEYGRSESRSKATGEYGRSEDLSKARQTSTAAARACQRLQAGDYVSGEGLSKATGT